MFNVSRKSKTEGASPLVSVKKPVVGRERLHFFDGELAKANAAVTDLEKRVATLEQIGIDAATADKALQLFLAQADGVAALQAHAAGHSKPDDQIAKLIAAQKATSEAANPAKTALPLAQDQLERARAEVIRLAQEKSKEIGRYLILLGDELAREYKKKFAELAILHDQIQGFAAGAAIYDDNVVMIHEPLKTPRFGLPTLTLGQTENDPFLRHTPSSRTVGQSTETWAAVRARLESDVDSDLSDLI
jgi:hypothetical protein